MVLKQRPPLLVTVSTAVLLVLGGAAAYFGLGQRLSSGPKIPVGMELVPDDALIALTLTTNENQWTRLRQLGSPESQKLLDRWLVTWRDRIISANGYRFRTDIEPWLGDEVTVAFLPKASGGEEATELVAVVPIAEPSKAQEILADPQDGISWVGRKYKDLTIQSITTTNGETYETTVLGSQWLVIASGTKGIEAVIDSFSGGASMATNDAYRRAFKHLHMPSATAHLYINAPVAAEVLTGNESLPGINGLVAAATLLPNGLDIEAATWLGPEDQPVYRDLKNARSSTPQRLPESTVLMISTSSIGPMWLALSEAEQLNAILPISAEALTKGLKTQTGLDLENDILPWLSGDFAFGLLPPANTSKSPVPMGQLALVAEVDDQKAANETWEQLDEVMANRFRFEVEPGEIDSQPVKQLVSFYGGISMSHGWLDKDVTFFGMGAEVLDEIAPHPNKSLKANNAFQTLLNISPQESSGYFFVDVDHLEDLQGTLPFPRLPDGPIFSAIKSIGVTTSVKDERSLRYDIFVELPKGRRVKPLPGGSINQDSSKEATE
ncbi:DUF3352 domain-containing protein [Leptothoe spongobia]|uniref:DUF3352 domain-containing protein n=1 Tax=Leptothoe spongobia TAU-MAC 1115 TaxID=1967444 RepID=A0A947DHM1_9CYAN|nr:DUF3352 domain-containing protein [Leptothoe spongobia]MBT9316499.1 DUF3352 domain-containing protein [Leptothoe spongobia TAU-MAC 1115]